MRKQLNLILKEYVRTRLKEIKREEGYTLFDLAGKLWMERRTVAAILAGEHSISGLTTALFFVFLVKDPMEEIQNLRVLFQDAIQGTEDERVS